MTDRNIPGIDDHTGREVIRSSSVRPVSDWTPPTIEPFVPPAERGVGMYQSGHITTTTPLTEAERARLAQHEETIRAGLQTFHEVGTALLDIRDSRLYRETHKTFEAYCADRWSISRPRAYQLIEASEVIANLSTIVDTPPPSNEAQARELAKLSSADQVLAWKTIVETAPGGKVTAGHVEAVAETLKEMRDTGVLTVSDEIMLPVSDAIQARLTDEAYERMGRQREHIEESKKKKAHVANNSGEYEWYTPAPFIEAARRAMGSIDTDPATSDTANKTVRATTIYTLANSGLDYANKWRGNVWLNPPYADSLVGNFTQRLVDQFNDNETRQAIVLVNNATETVWFQELLGHASAVCFPSSRIKFERPSGETGSPLQGQAILYLGENAADFAREFKPFGKVLYAG